jgi:hypothetical protein
MYIIPNSSGSSENWNIDNRPRKAFHVSSLDPIKSHLNVTFGGDGSKPIAIVSLLQQKCYIELEIVSRE